MKVSQYIKNKSTKENTVFRVKNGVGNYIYEGTEMREDEMEERFPTPEILVHKENPDKRKYWLHDKKSFR